MKSISPRVIPMEKVLNARELGGLPLSDGSQVRHGTLIRTGRLCNMSENDHRVLTQQWKVTDIVDLRNDQETAEHPDPPLKGAAYHQITLFPGMAAGISREDNGFSSPEDRVLQLAEQYRGGRASVLLREMYPRMVKEECCISGIRQFFQKLLEHGEGAFLWHCTSGKDRTGLTGALL